MDERAWQAGRQLHELYEFAAPQLSERKLRLFAIACCRRIPRGVYGPRGVRALEVAARLAEGEASEEERSAAEREAFEAHVEERSLPAFTLGGGPRWTLAGEMSSRALSLVVTVGKYPALDAAEFARRSVAPRNATDWKYESREEMTQCELFREIAGPRFRRVAFDPTWRVGEALRLAQEAYAGAWELMPILSDALEEAGCTDEEVLSHLRESGCHVPGCWALDLALGRE